MFKNLFARKTAPAPAPAEELVPDALRESFEQRALAQIAPGGRFLFHGAYVWEIETADGEIKVFNFTD